MEQKTHKGFSPQFLAVSPVGDSGHYGDYSATVLSWDGGMLTDDLGEFDPNGVEHGRIILRLNCDMASAQARTGEEEKQVAGDRDLFSKLPVLQKMKPCVSEVVWMFPEKSALLGGPPGRE